MYTCLCSLFSVTLELSGSAVCGSGKNSVFSVLEGRLSQKR